LIHGSAPLLSFIHKLGKNQGKPIKICKNLNSRDGETSDLKRKLVGGSSPSEAYGGGWEGLGLDGGKPALQQVRRS